MLDVQLAVYALVAERLAAEWGVPTRVAAAYAYVNRGAEERELARRLSTQTLAPAALRVARRRGRPARRAGLPADAGRRRTAPTAASGPSAATRTTARAGVLEGDDAVLRRFAALKHGADEA